MSDNFKVICLKDIDGWATKGKVYTFVDGRTTYDNGIVSATYENIDDFMSECIRGYFAPYSDSNIADSGIRREFTTGAVRDIQEGKGRCDLMPLDVVSRWLDDTTLSWVHKFKTDGKVEWLYLALDCFDDFKGKKPAMALEVSKHFEDGAKKYGENNWQKGIPTHCYIDSAVRHYLKWLRGDKDEPHDRAFVWNLLCCIWTCEHKPELNDYRKEGKVK